MPKFVKSTGFNGVNTKSPQNGKKPILVFTPLKPTLLQCFVTKDKTAYSINTKDKA